MQVVCQRSFPARFDTPAQFARRGRRGGECVVHHICRAGFVFVHRRTDMRHGQTRAEAAKQRICARHAHRFGWSCGRDIEPKLEPLRTASGLAAPYHGVESGARVARSLAVATGVAPFA
jgi:hypothetical protein